MTGRLVGTLWCGEVLELLSDYVDGSLDATKRREIERHLLGCSACEQFGREFAQMVQVIRERLAQPPPLESGAEGRLRDRLAVVLGSGGSDSSG